MSDLYYCKKCGEWEKPNIGMEWVDIKAKELKNGIKIEGASGEFLLCECKRCGYKWTDKTYEQILGDTNAKKEINN